MIDLKSPEQLHSMETGGRKLGMILTTLLQMAKPGMTLNRIEEAAQQNIKEASGTPSFSTVKDYHWATCLCINDVVVHGIPTEYALQTGDLLTIDVGMIYEGFHTDTAWSLIVGDDGRNSALRTFLDTGKHALSDAIAQVKIGNRIGNISLVIQRDIEGAGYGIVKSLVGHGVGRTLHEAPQVPGFLRNDIGSTPEIVPGMTIAIEVIYAMGKGDIVYANDDGWSIATRDRSLSAVFEHTVGVYPDGTVKILTADPGRGS